MAEDKLLTKVNQTRQQTIRLLQSDLEILHAIDSDYLTKTDAANTYATKAEVATIQGGSVDTSDLLSKSEAGSTYLTKTDASNNYLGKTAKAASATTADTATKATQDSAGNTISTTYLTKTEAGNTYLGKTAKASSATQADSATKATQDSAGNVITNTYLTQSTASTTYLTKTDYAKIPVPVQSGTLTYNGTTQSPCWLNYDPNKITIGGVTSSVDAGTFTAAFTPKAGYTWTDGSTVAKSVNWTIQKAQGKLDIPIDSVKLTVKTPTVEIPFSVTGDGAITVTSSNAAVTSAGLFGNVIHLSRVDAGNTTVTVSMAQTNNYTAATKTIAVYGAATPDVYTVALLHCDELSNIDECGNEWSVQGNLKIDTATKVFGTASFDDSTADFILMLHNLTLGGQDFTIDLWMNINGSGSMSTFGITNPARSGTAYNGSNQYCITWCNSNTLYMRSNYANSSYVSSSIARINNQWRHYAMVHEYDLKTVKIYIDGKLAMRSTLNQPRTEGLYFYFGGINDRYYPGKAWYDEIRISDGIARWTEEFTPPAAPY